MLRSGFLYKKCKKLKFGRNVDPFFIVIILAFTGWFYSSMVDIDGAYEGKHCNYIGLDSSNVDYKVTSFHRWW